MLLARLHALLGDREQTVRLLQRAYEVHAPGLFEDLGTPPYDFVRGDARVAALMTGIGLPQ